MCICPGAYLLRQVPRKLVHIRTGNGSCDQALLEVIERYLPEIKYLNAHNIFYLEINQERLTVIFAA